MINMSVVPEAPLAAEAGLAYCAIAMCTDYDSWKDDEDSVTVDMVMEVMRKNAANVKQLWLAAIPAIATSATSAAIEQKATLASSNIMGH